MLGAPLVLVVPCFDEERRLDRRAFDRALDARPELGLLFADDGSTDGTGAWIDAYAAARPDRVLALHLPRNRGKAEAVRQGVLRAIHARRPAWVGYWDADLATPLDELASFEDELRRHPDAAVLLGSRVKLMGRVVERDPARHYAGRVFATLASLTLGLPVYDTQCGAKLVEAGLAAQLFAEPFVSGWVFDVELLARLVDREGPEGAARRVVEVPLRTWTDVAGSKVRPADFPRALLALARIRRRHPGPRRVQSGASPGSR